MSRRKIATATALLAITALGGCNWFRPAPAESLDNNSMVENVAEPTPTAPLNLALPTEENAAAADARDTPAAPDAQTIDDADATGMTARVHRGEAAGNATAP